MVQWLKRERVREKRYQRDNYLINQYEMERMQSVCSPTVRIIAFQAIDPGSTPGKRNYDRSSFSCFLLCSPSGFSLVAEFLSLFSVMLSKKSIKEAAKWVLSYVFVEVIGSKI